MRLAVCGSRNWPDIGLVRSYVRANLKPGHILVSGCARGVDEVAQSEAKSLGHNVSIYYPRPDLHGSGAGYAQHRQIVANCDRIAVFVSGRGAKHYIAVAAEMGKDCEVFEYRGGFQI